MHQLLVRCLVTSRADLDAPKLELKPANIRRGAITSGEYMRGAITSVATINRPSPSALDPAAGRRADRAEQQGTRNSQVE